MKRRSLIKLFGVAPFVKVPKDRTLYSLISGGRGELRITSYDRTDNHCMSVYYDFTKISKSLFNSIEKAIIEITESVDWVFHFAELYIFGPYRDLADVRIERLYLYKDNFGTYRYRIVGEE